MKEKDAVMGRYEHPVLMFVEKDDGTYGPVCTGSYMVNNYFDDYQEKMRYFEKDCREKLASGRISPVAFHMMLKDMTPADVAARTGLTSAEVKKHMNPVKFEKMKVETARRYAEVFGVDMTELFVNPDNMAAKKVNEYSFAPVSAAEREKNT